MATNVIQQEDATSGIMQEDGTSYILQENGTGGGGGGSSVTPFGLQMLVDQFGPVAAATLNGVLQR